MQKLFILGVIMIFCGTAGWWFFLQSPPLQHATPSTPTATPKVPTATLEQKSVGQLFMIGHWSNTPTASTTQMINTYGFGGVIIMDTPADPTEIKTWTDEWNSVSDIPLLIAIDQEGGPVTRLQGANFIQTGQQDIHTQLQAYEIGKTRGQQLAALGITMNFAPVLDTAENATSFMYERTFPDKATSPSLAAAMISGMKSEDIIAVPKHFPGHADTDDDSHLMLPEINIDQTALDAFTTPFRALLTTNQPQAIMTAHVLFPKIDTVPATLSEFFLTTYLRDTLGYKNIIITDDMSMNAIDQQWTTARATQMALEAGADIVLFAAEPRLAITALAEVQKAADADIGFTQKLIQSVERVQTLRYTQGGAY